GALPMLRSALPPGYHAAATGLAELSAGADAKGPGVLVETLIGAAGALAVLAFVFGSVLALLPLLIAAVAIMTTFLITLGLTYLTSISFVVQFLIALVGLGVAIDYSLLVVTRWREERARGRDNNSAVIAAMNTAGRAVVFSGLTVGVGLLALVVLPVPGLRSIGLGGMLIPLVSVLVRPDAARQAQERLASVPGIATVAAPAAADSNRAGTTVLIAIPRQANLNSSASTAVTQARNALSGLPGVIGITGVGALQLDYVHAVFGQFPLMLAVVAGLTLLLLAGAFRSILLPVKAVVLNLPSLAGTFGAI